MKIHRWCYKNIWYILQFTAKSAASQLKLFNTDCLKLVSAIFYQVFIFHQMIALQKLWKMFFISCKNVFYFPVSHCLRGWSKKNLKIHDVINSPNKNLITCFVWYLDKEIGWDIEALSIDRELNKENFYGKIKQKMCTKS